MKMVWLYKNSTASTALSAGVHAEQHYEYHRHQKPGDQLTMTSQLGKTGRKKAARRS